MQPALETCLAGLRDDSGAALPVDIVTATRALLSHGSVVVLGYYALEYDKYEEGVCIEWDKTPAGWLEVLARNSVYEVQFCRNDGISYFRTFPHDALDDAVQWVLRVAHLEGG